MSENTASITASIQPEIPSTQGMTTKVVKGSLWTLLGTVLPLMITLFATPIIIRFLGTEGYGVLLLVGLIPNYFVFADFGMGVASTKFGSEAYAQGLKEKEGQIVRTAALISLILCIPIALILFFFSSFIITNVVSVPPHWQAEANTGLKIVSLTYLVGVLMGIFNTPQLTRLRMDLNSLVNTITKILLPLGTVIALYFGGGIVWSSVAGLIAISIGLVGHLYFSGRLLPNLFQITIDRNSIKQMIKYGAGLMFASMAVTTLVNLEKFALSSLVSVESLAFYSIAFTFANMTTLFSSAMIQSLVPAFSQLLEPEKKKQFDSLFSRGMRLNLVWLFPTIMLLFVIAKPFFTVWAGAEFGRESTFPFYILLIGLFFQILAYIPNSAIVALGRTDVLAKVYWIELAVFVPITFLLVSSLGINGAAIAWSFRAVIDTLIMAFLAKYIAQIPLKVFSINILTVGILILTLPMIFVYLFDNFSIWVIILVPFSLCCYSLFVWKVFVEKNEKEWIINKVENLKGKLK